MWCPRQVLEGPFVKKKMSIISLIPIMCTIWEVPMENLELQSSVIYVMCWSISITLEKPVKSFTHCKKTNIQNWFTSLYVFIIFHILQRAHTGVLKKYSISMYILLRYYPCCWGFFLISVFHTLLSPLSSTLRTLSNNSQHFMKDWKHLVVSFWFKG